MLDALARIEDVEIFDTEIPGVLGEIVDLPCRRAVGHRNRGQVVARSRHHLFVAGAPGDKRLEGDLDIDRETCRAALVGLEGVAEAAVLVLVPA